MRGFQKVPQRPLNVHPATALRVVIEGRFWHVNDGDVKADGRATAAGQTPPSPTKSHDLRGSHRHQKQESQ